MHEYSPLKALELRAIEDSLNASDFEKAQVLLSQVGTQPDLQTGVAYLATRLLFLRGRLDAVSVVERMRELVGANPQFAEARTLMEHCLELLRATGSDPPPQVTPPPGALFPSEPPGAASHFATSDTSPFNVSPVANLAVPHLSMDLDEAPESWPVPGFQPSSHDVVDEDRPTFVPEAHSDTEFEVEVAIAPESLAPTEFPAPLEPRSAPGRAVTSREIRVDTRQEAAPVSPSIPPPSRYDPSLPKPEGRYSLQESSPEVGLAPPRPPSGTGRYRLTNPVVEEVVPASLRPRSKRPERRRRANSGGEGPVGGAGLPTAPDGTSHRSARAQSAAQPRDEPAALLAGAPSSITSPAGRSMVPYPPPSSGTVLANPTPTVVRAEYLDFDDREEPTPFRVPRPSSGAPPSSQDPPSSYAWNDPERQFTRGDATSARARLETRALEILEPYPTEFEAFVEKTEEIVHLLTTTPVLQYFGPFDRSLCSLPRLELGIRTLYSGASSLPVASVRPLVALYVGEVLQTSHRGSWRGVPERPSTWAVEAGAHIWQPLRCISQLLTDPPGQALLQSVGTGLAKRGTLAWMASRPTATPLARPWHDPLTAQKQTELGQWVTHSPWATCCERLFGQPLDGSIDSLRALDRLLDVLCDSAEAPKPNDAWLSRTATLAGAYVGFVLITNAHAVWIDRTSGSEQGIALELPGGIIATPVANVVARATSRKRSQLADYVRALLRRSL